MEVSRKWIRDLSDRLWLECRLAVVSRGQFDEQFCGAWTRLCRVGGEQPQKREFLIAAAMRFGRACRESRWDLAVCEAEALRLSDVVAEIEEFPRQLLAWFLWIGTVVARSENREWGSVNRFLWLADSRVSSGELNEVLDQLRDRGLIAEHCTFEGFSVYTREVITPRGLDFLEQIGCGRPSPLGIEGVRWLLSESRFVPSLPGPKKRPALSLVRAS